MRLAEIDFRDAAIGFARLRGRTDRTGAAGDQDHRTYPVAIDEAVMERLVGHRRRADARARSNGVALADIAFVFSAECDGSAPRSQNRVTKDTHEPPRHSTSKGTASRALTATPQE